MKINWQREHCREIISTAARNMAKWGLQVARRRRFGFKTEIQGFLLPFLKLLCKWDQLENTFIAIELEESETIWARPCVCVQRADRCLYFEVASTSCHPAQSVVINSIKTLPLARLLVYRDRCLCKINYVTLAFSLFLGFYFYVIFMRFFILLFLRDPAN